MDLVNHLEGRLLFAVPKKGRLQQSSLELLAGSDIQFRRSPRLDIALVKNHPIALVFLPAADIPTFVGEGRVDLGITGRDQVEEHDAKRAPSLPSRASKEEGVNGEAKGGVNGSGVEEVLDLGFGKCKLQVQVPEEGKIKDPRELVGKNVVTSFTGLTERYFRALEEEVLGEDGEDGKEEGKRKLKTNIMYVGGSVEAACALGVADGIVDLVESGETMRAAGLTPLSTVLPSTAVLIKSTKPSNPALVSLITSRIKGVIAAQSFVLCQYNIPRHLLQKAKEITPGKRAPTVTALEEEGWVAISSMVPKRDVAGVMDRLTEVGATDVLVLEISNSRAS